MRIFYAFLVVMAAAMLFMLPITEGVYDFRTDLRQQNFNEETGVGVTTANLTLSTAVYDDDVTTVECISDNYADTPVVVEYHSSTRLVDISGLAASDNRTLTISYDIDALGASGGISTLVDRIDWVWLACVILLAPAAIVSMVIRK